PSLSPGRRSGRDLDHPAGGASAGVAGGLRAVVVDTDVDDDRAAEDVVRRAAAERDALGADVDPGDAAGVGDDVVHVAGVVRTVADAAMGGGGRIEVAACTAAVGGGAVAAFVDVDRVRAVAAEAAELAFDAHAAVDREHHQ